jgi:uncharacterized protein YegJ (DUF2314 family)
MNSIVISKVEYRIIGEQNFTALDIVPESGTLNEDPDDTSNGQLVKTSVQFNIANVTVEKSNIIKKIEKRRLQVRITDTNNQVHMVGDDYYFARMSFQKVIDKTPGSFNGWRCAVSCNSPSGSSVS